MAEDACWVGMEPSKSLNRDTELFACRVRVGLVITYVLP